MKLVDLKVRAAQDGEVVIATIIEQRNEGGSWKEIERHVVRSDQDSSRTLLLEDNERIIVDGRAQTEVVMIDNTVMRIPTSEAQLAPEPAVVVPGPLPPGTESQIGVWREQGEQDWSRTGKRYRIY
jgi:hypothetical protein